jgi:hypothetical protein
MTAGGAFLILTVLALAYVVVATVVTVRRGGRGPADPPASHLRIDPSGFPGLSRPSLPSSLGLRTPRRAAAR